MWDCFAFISVKLLIVGSGGENERWLVVSVSLCKCDCIPGDPWELTVVSSLAVVSLYLLSCLLCCYLVLYVCSRGPEYFFKGLVVCVFPLVTLYARMTPPQILIWRMACLVWLLPCILTFCKFRHQNDWNFSRWCQMLKHYREVSGGIMHPTGPMPLDLFLLKRKRKKFKS